MMPRLPSFVLRRLGGGAVLLLLSALCLALPARQVLIPLWPNPVDEILVGSGSGAVERRFVPAPPTGSMHAPIVVRSRPISLWRLETQAGDVSYAWLAGVRGTEGQLLPALPDWFKTERLEGPLPESMRLVLRTAGGETREVDGATVRRMYRPNGMTLPERVSLWRDRLVERWQVISLTAARMTPPAR